MDNDLFPLDKDFVLAAVVNYKILSRHAHALVDEYNREFMSNGSYWDRYVFSDIELLPNPPYAMIKMITVGDSCPSPVYIPIDYLSNPDWIDVERSRREEDNRKRAEEIRRFNSVIRKGEYTNA